MDFNFWDDRTIETYNANCIHPCYGCCDFVDGECVSNFSCLEDEAYEEIN